MSGICGAIHWDNQPVEALDLQQMAKAAAYRGPDGVRFWVKKNIGIANQALNITPESAHERQPLTSSDGSLVLTADARIDNREDLITRLSAKAFIRIPPYTDADLILAAYQAWDTNAASHLIGDFAFAIWDERKNRLYAARDRMGCRAFYYSSSGKRLLWATEAQQILAFPGFEKQINPWMIGLELLSPGSGDQHKAQTYFNNIFRLGPAEQLIATQDGLKIESYWDFDPNLTIRYKNDEAYQEHLLELLSQAVRRRLRSQYSASIIMSGGKDSTTIGAIAAREVASHSEGVAPNVSAVTFDTTQFPQLSEASRSQAVAKQAGIPLRTVIMDDLWPHYDDPACLPHPDEPYESHLHKAIRQGITLWDIPARPRIWLTGMGGDDAIGLTNPFYFQELLFRHGLMGLLRETQAQAQLYQLSQRDVLWGNFAQPCLQATPLIHKIRRELLRHKQEVFPPWLAPTLTSYSEIKEWRKQLRIIHMEKEWQWLMASQDSTRLSRYMQLRKNNMARLRIWFERFSATLGTQTSAPFDDTDLLTFCLAIPAEQHSKGLYRKLLLRHSTKGLLPDSVRERQGPRSDVPHLPTQLIQMPDRIAAIGKMLTHHQALLAPFINVKLLKENLQDNPGNLLARISFIMPLGNWLQQHSAS